MDLGLISLILAIPLGILTNILTPKFIDWISRQSKRSTEKQIRVLEKQIAKAEDYKNNTYKLIAFGFRYVLYFLMVITMFIVMNEVAGKLIRDGEENIALFGTTALGYLISAAIMRFVNIMENIQNYESYVQKTNKRIVRLQSKQK